MNCYEAVLSFGVVYYAVYYAVQGDLTLEPVDDLSSASNSKNDIDQYFPWRCFLLFPVSSFLSFFFFEKNILKNLVGI